MNNITPRGSVFLVYTVGIPTGRQFHKTVAICRKRKILTKLLKEIMDYHQEEEFIMRQYISKERCGWCAQNSKKWRHFQQFDEEHDPLDEEERVQRYLRLTRERLVLYRFGPYKKSLDKLLVQWNERAYLAIPFQSGRNTTLNNCSHSS